MILEELWNDDRCRACMVQLATSEPPDAAPHIFSAYVECLFNALIYLFKVGAPAIHAFLWRLSHHWIANCSTKVAQGSYRGR